MKVLCSSVLTFESVLVLLIAPVAIVVQHVDASTSIAACAGLIITCMVAIRGLKKRWGLALGWLVQLLLVLCGLVVPTMFFLGFFFAVTWFFAIRVGRKGDAIKAAHAVMVTD